MPQKPTYEDLERQVQELKAAEAALKKTQAALRDSEEKYRTTFESITDSITITRIEDGLYLYVNDGFCHQSGYSREEVLGRTPSDINLYANPAERDRFVGILKKEGQAKDVVITFRRKNGEFFYSEFSAKPISYAGEACLLAQSRDINKRMRAVEALRKSEKRFRLIAENVADVIWTMDMSFRFTYISPSILQQRGYTAEEATAHALDELVLPESLAEIMELADQKLKHIDSGSDEGWQPVLFEAEQYCKDGSTIWTHNNARFLPGSDNKPESILGVTRDITERRQIEAALRESEQKFRSITEQSSDLISLTDSDGVITYASPSSEQLFAAKPNKMVGRHFIEFLDEASVLPAMQAFQETIQEGLPVNGIELLMKRMDGSRFYGELTGSIYDSKSTQGTLVVIRDITERKQALKALKKSEERIARSKKMESLGLLAGGVAHDLNNVLSGIVSYPELILMDLPKESKFRKPIETIQASGLRAAAIVQDLLTVARGVAIEKKPLGFNILIGEYLNSPEFEKLKALYPDVDVKTDLNADLFNISGSHVHVTKIVMNLVTNATEAVAGSGSITIATSNRYIDYPLKKYDRVNSGEYVVLSVSDNGPGVPPEELDRIFEPFYTKKVMGRSGTGLGLAVVWNIMLDHKGYVDVTTDKNGTTFDLYFPISREALPEKDLRQKIGDYKGNGEMILVVDDEERQREIAGSMLKALGYRTKTVASGEAAVAYLKKNRADLLLLDMIMDPGMNGRQTYERIIAIHPHQKAIVVSGFSVTEDVRVAQKLGAGEYVKKPYSFETLGQAVKKALEA